MQIRKLSCWVVCFNEKWIKKYNVKISLIFYSYKKIFIKYWNDFFSQNYIFKINVMLDLVFKELKF